MTCGHVEETMVQDGVPFSLSAQSVLDKSDWREAHDESEHLLMGAEHTIKSTWVA